jgi:hypothetical protein
MIIVVASVMPPAPTKMTLSTNIETRVMLQRTQLAAALELVTEELLW